MFVLSDESINSYGMRILTRGINLGRFEKNPVMLWNHNRYDHLPIGKWDGVKKSEGKLVGEPVFDEGDDFATKIKGKVDKKIINACSIGIAIKAISDKPEDMVAGQTRPTITSCDLVEVSMVDIPSNSNAVRFYAENENGEYVELNMNGDADIDSVLAKFKQPDPEPTPNPTPEQKGEQITLAQVEQVVTNALKKLLPEELSKLSFTQEQKPLTAEEIVNLINKKEKTPEQMTATEKIQAKPDWTFVDWWKNEPETLKKLKAENEALWKQMREA